MYRPKTTTYASFSQHIGMCEIFFLLCSPVEENTEIRCFNCRLCVRLHWVDPPVLLSSSLLSSSLTLLVIREESFHYLQRLGCQSPRPWPKFVVLRRHIGEMISGVISPPLHEAFIPPHGPLYLQARSGSLTGRLLLSFYSFSLPLYTCWYFIMFFIFLSVSVHCCVRFILKITSLFSSAIGPKEILVEWMKSWVTLYGSVD